MKRLFFLVLIVVQLGSLQAQNARPTGLICSEERYRALPLLPAYSGTKYNEIPLKVSLKRFCPVPGDQQQIGACVGWAVGYGAMTMMRAQRAGVSDPALLTQWANSAAFIYNQVKRNRHDCSEGAYLEDALELVKAKGDCLERSFNYLERDCYQTPGEEKLAEASAFRIRDYAAVFAPEEAPRAKVGKVCKVLATQTPLVIGLGVTSSFWNILPGQRLWDPPAEETVSSYHALVVVGYDNVEKRFELMNSFGSGWGQGGFIQINYEDFERLCRYAYVIIPEESSAFFVADRSSPAPEKVAFSGEFVFRRPAGYLSDEEGREILFFEEVPTRQLSETGLYTTQESEFQVGDVFQLLAREIPRGRYAYVFSQSPGGEINLHFPKHIERRPTAGFVLEKTAEIVIPGEETVLQLPSPGDDYLCILYSLRPIDDMDQRLQQLRAANAPFPERVSQVFGDLLIPRSQIRFSDQRMSFQASTTAEAGGLVVPLILRVTAR